MAAGFQLVRDYQPPGTSRRRSDGSSVGTLKVIDSPRRVGESGAAFPAPVTATRLTAAPDAEVPLRSTARAAGAAKALPESRSAPLTVGWPVGGLPPRIVAVGPTSTLPATVPDPASVCPVASWNRL